MGEALTGLELRSMVTSGGKLVLNLEEVQIDAPGPDEVVVRVEAAPINPSDLGLLLGPADVATLSASGTPDRPILTADIPAQRMPAMEPRVNQSMPVGNEGSGTVILAGANLSHLMGKRVGMIGGGMYATYRKLAAQGVIPMPEGASAADGASMFVNPLTALGFVETMKAEGHKAIVHTAAASNLGQMLNRICLKDGIPLVNIVRSAEQAEILKKIGAPIILDSSAEDFQDQLVETCHATGATLAFDAIGGGKLANQILHAMEKAASRGQAYSRYGSSVLKQVYIYGMLDVGPTYLDRQFGLTWSVSGWLLTPFLMKAGMETNLRLRQRVSDELTSTFASHYTATIGLAEALKPEVVTAYQRKATGEKYLIDPSL